MSEYRWQDFTWRIILRCDSGTQGRNREAMTDLCRVTVAGVFVHGSVSYGWAVSGV